MLNYQRVFNIAILKMVRIYRWYLPIRVMVILTYFHHGYVKFNRRFFVQAMVYPSDLPGKDMRRKGSGLCLIYGQKQCMLMIQEIGT